MANSKPVWHDIFRRVTLKPDNITLEAETYEDTLNIVRGPGVNFGTTNVGTDTFEINVDYDISVPAATTKISLEDVNGNLSEITLTPGRGIAINRISAQELEFESFSVTETDTLHTVTSRNNITSNKIFVNNIEVGTIASNSAEDGFTGYDAGHNLIGDGTLDNPMRFSPLYQDSLLANNTDQFEFVAVGPGTLAYAANYVFDTAATTGSVTLEREDPLNPGNWTTLDTQSGNTAGISYFIDGTYSELYSGSVTYRLTFAWTGNTGTATWYTNDTFEGGAYTPIANPQLKTDTTAKTVDINDIQFFQNTIRTTASNTDVVFDLSGTGQVRIIGDVTADNFYGNLTGNVTGDVSGNAGTVTNGVYTTGSYSDPSWITSLDGTKVTNAVLTSGSYYDPTWITGLDASKIIGSISLSDITIDGTIRIFDNVIETTTSNADLELRTSGVGNIISHASIIPADDLTHDLGAPSQQWNSLYVGGNTIFIGGVPLGVDGNGNLASAGGVFSGSLEIPTVTSTTIYGAGVWTTGGSLSIPTGISNPGGAGTQTAGLSIGGAGFTNNSLLSTEEYDGTAWTLGGNLIAARSQTAGVGTQNAALAAGGYGASFSAINSTEEYDGATWTSGGNLASSRYGAIGAGTQTDAIAFGGLISFAGTDVTEEYDGTTWTSGGSLSGTRWAHAGAGPSTSSAFTTGGFDSVFTVIATTEEYNGTVWSSGGNLIQARKSSAGAGSQTAGLVFGGADSFDIKLTSTEEYDGTTWSSGGSLSEGVGGHGGTGTQVAALAFGGQRAFTSAVTEEYTKAEIITLPTTSGTKSQIRFNDYANKFEGYTGTEWKGFGATQLDIVEATTVPGPILWSSGGNLNTARRNHAAAGTQSAGLAFGGSFGPLNSTEEYDGTTWTIGGTLSTARENLAGTGTQTAALAIGGNNTRLSSTEEYDGTTWTSGGVLNDGRQDHAAAGTQTAGLTFGGTIASGDTNKTEEYDGTTWTSGGNLSAVRAFHAGAGIQTSVLAIAGFVSSSNSNSTEEYDGSAWTSGGNLNTARYVHAGAGIQNAALAFGGSVSYGNFLSSTEEYDGSVWTAGSNLATARGYFGGAGTQTAALAFGGFETGFNTLLSTEEYGQTIISVLPTAGSTAQIRYNNLTDSIEIYDGTSWTSKLSSTTIVGILDPIGWTSLPRLQFQDQTGGAGPIVIGDSAGSADINNTNISIGNETGQNIENSAGYNILIGYRTGYAFSTGDDNVFIGRDAGGGFFSTTPGTGEKNVVIGGDAGANLGSSSYNVLLGISAGGNIVDGNGYNIAIGPGALFSTSNATVTDCIAIGEGALYSEQAGYSNIAIGRQSQNLNLGVYNTSLGDNSMLVATGANNSTAIGMQSLLSLTTGDNNTAIGQNSGADITTGSNNVVIGSYTAFNERTQSNNIFISDGSANLRVFINSSGNIGINQTSPATRLDINGNMSQNIVAVAALDIDCSQGNYFTKTINGASIFTFSNVPASRAYSFTLELTHTSGAVTWPPAVVWPLNSTPALTTGRTHLFMFVTDDGGTRWRGAALVDYLN